MNDQGLFWMLAQQNPESALFTLDRPSDVSEKVWRTLLLTIMVIGREHRAVFCTFSERANILGSVDWANPEIQQQFIREKINSRTK